MNLCPSCGSQVTPYNSFTCELCSQQICTYCVAPPSHNCDGGPTNLPGLAEGVGGDLV